MTLNDKNIEKRNVTRSGWQTGRGSTYGQPDAHKHTQTHGKVINIMHPAPSIGRAEGRKTSIIQIHTTHTHTHWRPFNGPLSGTTRVGRYQKGRTNLDFTEARDSEWQWHQLEQVCISLQTDNHVSTPPLSFYRPDALHATQPTVSKHWRHNTRAMHTAQLTIQQPRNRSCHLLDHLKAHICYPSHTCLYKLLNATKTLAQSSPTVWQQWQLTTVNVPWQQTKNTFNFSPTSLSALSSLFSFPLWQSFPQALLRFPLVDLYVLNSAVQNPHFFLPVICIFS